MNDDRNATTPNVRLKTGARHELSANHVKRDALVSALLQDRAVLRLICAPHGFGKTALAHEYAARLFADNDVAWIDAASPDLLLALDEGKREGVLAWGREPKLIVLDGLPWLHEQRAQALSNIIDSVLFDGIEMLATVTPSCDCLSALQPESLVIRASDLLVSEQESIPGSGIAVTSDERALRMGRWHDAGKRFLGYAPLAFWGMQMNAQGSCIEGLFSERLSLSTLKGMFAMLLLGQGSLEDLEHVEASLRSDDVAMLARDYPVFGIDHVSGAFSVGQFRFEDLKQAIVSNALESLVVEGSLSLPQRAIGLILERGDTRRASAVMDAFCSDETCASWLIERGWDFLDSGGILLAANFLARCPERMYVQSHEIQAMHAWIAGLSGDRREACHIARSVLAKARGVEGSKVATIAAHLAMMTFDEDAIVSSDKPDFGTGDMPMSPIDLLASVLETCTSVECARAFRFANASDDMRYETARRAPGKQRVKALRQLFTENAKGCGESKAFRLGLHLLAHVDSPELHRLVQDLGCEAVLEMRRNGVKTFSAALLTRDLWQSGYFGLMGPVVDRRDAKILDGAAHMLNELARCCGSQAAHIPWEATRSKIDKAAARGGARVLLPETEGMYVRMFGGFELTIGDRYLSESKWRSKARALFAILVLNQGRDVPREDIFEQIWPGLSHAHALDNFYTAWSNCVSHVGKGPYIERNGEYCRVDPRFVHSDVAEFEQLARHLLTADSDSSYLLDTYAKIEALYRGKLLPSETRIRTINAQRNRYRALYVDAMVAASECAMRLGDTRISLWFARKAMEEEQGREDVYRVLMKAQVAAGQRCPAIKTYLVCREYLRNALGLDPSLETRELYDALITTDPGLLRLELSAFADNER